MSSAKSVEGDQRGSDRRALKDRIVLGSMGFCVVLTAVACGSDGPGAIWVDPGKFAFYHCEDLARRMKEVTARESELRALIEKANESTSGAVIGSIAYRSDYEAALSEKKLLERAAAEKKCSLTVEYQSDQLIR